MISGVGSGSIESLLQSYRTLEEQPIRQLETQRSGINNRISIFNDLKKKLDALQSAMKKLSGSGTTSIFGNKISTVSDESYMTVTTTSTATPTSHTVFISQLAKADKIISNQFSLAGTDLATSLGAGTHSFEISVNGTPQQVSIDITGEEDNETIINRVVSAVNDTADIGIRASVVNDTDSTARLVFTSQETGADFEMNLTDITGTFLANLGMNDSTAMSGNSGGYVYDSSELNARITVDGISIERNSNTIENAIGGLTLTLQKPHAAGESPATLNVDNDVESIQKNIEDFVTAYNDVMSFIQTNTQINTTTYERSALSGDFAVSNLKLQMRTLLTQPVTGLADGSLTMLAQIGITTDRYGKLSISDSGKLEENLKGNLDQVSAIFNSADGMATRFVDFLDSYTSADGIIEKRKSVYQGNINMINTRISRLEDLVDRKIESYRQQFSQLQAAYNMYSSQYASLGSLMQGGFVSY